MHVFDCVVCAYLISLCVRVFDCVVYMCILLFRLLSLLFMMLFILFSWNNESLPVDRPTDLTTVTSFPGGHTVYPSLQYLHLLPAIQALQAPEPLPFNTAHDDLKIPPALLHATHTSYRTVRSLVCLWPPLPTTLHRSPQTSPYPSLEKSWLFIYLFCWVSSVSQRDSTWRGLTCTRTTTTSPRWRSLSPTSKGSAASAPFTKSSGTFTPTPVSFLSFPKTNYPFYYFLWFLSLFFPFPQKHSKQAFRGFWK